MKYVKNIGVSILLIVVLTLAVAYGCCNTAEFFENSTPMKKTMEEEVADAVKKDVENKEEKNKSELISEAKNMLAKEDKIVEEKNAAEKEKAKKEASEEILNKQEQELFDQITKNSIPTADLEKLIRAGVLTENMVEKFLNQIDKLNSEEKIEGFCSGQDCYAKF